MDSMEVNKGIAAVLVGGIVFFLTGLIGDILVHETLPEKPVLNIAAPGRHRPRAARPSRRARPRSQPLLASADAKAGDQFAKSVCVACHTFDKGGKPGVGPNLYGVVGGPHDHEQGFNYSPAMQKFKGQPWTFDALNEWLYKPSAYAPGTRMSFAGITNDKQRADVIAYLRSLSRQSGAAAGARGSRTQAGCATGRRRNGWQCGGSPAQRSRGCSPGGAPTRRRSSSRLTDAAAVPAEIDRFIAAAEAAADVAGAVVRPFFRAGIATDTKSDRSPGDDRRSHRRTGDARRAGGALSGPWHPGRGIRPGPTRRRRCAGCSTRSTARAPSSPAGRPSAP